MQISYIYSNRADVFGPIAFNCGHTADRLNVILGEVHHPKDRRKDSHNLGKTTLVQLIDFLLLKGTSPDQFLIKHEDRFKSFVFYIEIKLNSGEFVTIRRSAAEPNKIALKKYPERRESLLGCPDDIWDHRDMSREDAAKLLDGWLDLKILKPYDYRQAITYFLRTQGDYGDELQLQKFSSGKDRHWKPFVAHLFGFKESPIERKYELDEQIERLKIKQAEQQATVAFSEDQLPELTARISVLQHQVDELEGALDAFNFDAEEKKIVRELVESIERDIAETNERLYNVRYDIRQINSALDHKDKFDLGVVDEIFEEVGIHFPSQLKRSYEDLVAFNKSVTHERNVALRGRLKNLVGEEADLVKRKSALDQKRQAQLNFLRSTDTFEKFKELQKDLTRQRAQLVYLDEQRKQLDRVAETAREVREAERERGRVVDEIKSMVARPTAVYERFSAIFNSYCQRVLNHDGIFYFKVNNSNNFDYQIGLQIVGQVAATSSLSEGTSYKKLLCALFDLALLKVYEDASFFHFVYHDGIFEALDDRKKIVLLEIIREQIANSKTQYILTLIDSDIPRDAEGRKVAFPQDEVVLRLHDDGNEGRLFRMAEF